MSKNKQFNSISKLQNTLSSRAKVESKPPLKPGLLQQNKQSYLKTKSFRLRDSDIAALKNITNYVNNNDDRKCYTDSQVVRGIINYIENNLEKKYKSMIAFIRSSS